MIEWIPDGPFVVATSALISLGFSPFCPRLSHYVSGHAWDEWMRVGLDWVPVCDAVLLLPGESRGAEIECAVAKERGIPVFTDTMQLFAYRRDSNTQGDAA